MNIKRLVFLVLLLTALFSSCSTMKKNVKYSRLPWKVGQWVEYIVNYPDRSYIVRYSIVGKEDSLYKVETQYIENEDTIFTQVLTDYGFKNIYSMIVQQNSDKPYMFTDMNGKIKMSSDLDSLFNMGNAVDSFSMKWEVSSVGDTVPVFKYLSKKVDAKFSPYIPLIGLYYISDGIKERKLIQYSYTGAQTHITQKPLKIQPWQIYSKKIQRLFEGEQK